MSSKGLSDLLDTVQVPGHPGFVMFDKDRNVASASTEGRYRAGFYKAVEDMLNATQSDGDYERGYQHAVHEIDRLMIKNGRTSTRGVGAWLSGIGRRWRDKAPGNIKVLPPELV